MPEQNKKLAGFEALYKVDQEKRQQQRVENADEVGSSAATTEERGNKRQPRQERTSNKVGKSESNIVSNITTSPAVDNFEPTTFKADRRKVKALKRLALDLEPTRKLQDLFDEALADLLNKYGRTVE